MNRKLLIASVLCVMFCVNAEAAITRAAVNEALFKISVADRFPIVPITYEKSSTPNAWVHYESKNKYSIHVTEGLMRILNSEAEIAGVLGHEIGHVRLGHHNKRTNRQAGWTLLGLALGQYGGAVRALGSVGMNLAESGFSRGQEVEADDYGTELLKKAGYDPYGLYNAMKAFADSNHITQPNGFNSHPPTVRRLKHLQDKAKELSSK